MCAAYLFIIQWLRRLPDVIGALSSSKCQRSEPECWHIEEETQFWLLPDD